MKNRVFANIKSSRFTLFELLISVGLLVMLSVVLLRTFALTADFWRKSDEQANLQADAKTVFNLLSNELDSIIYRAGTTDNDTFQAPILIDIDNSGRRLCFVTHTAVRNPSSTYHSNICKVAYRFSAPASGNAGTLHRDYIGDADVTNTNAGYFDFAQTTAAGFYPANLGSRKLVIDTVLDFSVTAYNSSNNTINATDTFASAAIRYLRVRLVLLPENRFDEYNGLSSAEQEIYRAKYARTFYKTFYIKPINQ